jgi:hypothetical protein
MKVEHFNKVKELVNDKCEELYQEINEALGANVTDKSWYIGMEGIEREFLDSLASCLKEGYTKELLASIRADIQASGFAVPVGVFYYGSSKPLPYRWINDETYQVFYSNQWQEAQSTHWDFPDKEAESGEGLPLYDEETISLAEFMALPDAEKVKFFIRIYPEVAGNESNDYDIGINIDDSYCELATSETECSEGTWRIGTGDSREPQFCENHYREINKTSDFIKRTDRP